MTDEQQIAPKVDSTYIPDLKDKILAVIKTIYDPEIPVDIYELGLIYEINTFPVNNVHVLMTLTSPSCPSAEAIPTEVEQKIKTIDWESTMQDVAQFLRKRELDNREWQIQGL